MPIKRIDTVSHLQQHFLGTFYLTQMILWIKYKDPVSKAPFPGPINLGVVVVVLPLYIKSFNFDFVTFFMPPTVCIT